MALANPIESAERQPVDERGAEAAEVRAHGAEADTLDAAYAYCREVTRERARNFYYGLRLTPEPRRSAIYSVYAWMRAADDAVDEPGSHDERERRLAAFERWTDSVLDRSGTRGQTGCDAEEGNGRILIALAATARSYPLDRAIFRDMLAGMRRDLQGGEFADDAELTRYCYCVAGTAGLACLAIWGLRPGVDAARARELAIHRGQAFQRTNILRDFAEDYDGGHPAEQGPRRVYIPRDALRRQGIDAAKLRAWEPAWSVACERLVLEQAALARQHYAASAGLESMIDPACAPTLWAMTRIYSGLLEQIEADPRRVVGERARLAPAAKATIAIRAAIGARMHRW